MTTTLTTTTMLNLQSKKTLPRQVIKWMQGLDLSYSVKDYRKDMNNGYLIGEIISRYQPGKIPMHAFQNTQNNLRKDNNWSQLHLFFSKHTLRDTEIKAEQYSAIQHATAGKHQQLYQFICKLYTVCTKKIITQNPMGSDLPQIQNNNPNLTAAYLLKEDGLEKLDNSGRLQLSAVKSNNVQDNYKLEEKMSPDRLPTRKIVPGIDNNSRLVDVVNIGIKADGRKANSKRKSWQANKQQSNQDTDNNQTQKSIYDYLDSIIDQCLPQTQIDPSRTLLMGNHKFRPTQLLKMHILQLDQQFLCNLFNQLQLNVTELVPIILKDTSQIWKFFVFLLRLVRHFQLPTQELLLLISVIRSYAVHSHEKQPKKVQKIFCDSLFNVLLTQLRNAKQWKKKQQLMSLLYDFLGRDLSDKKSALSKLKQLLNTSQHSLYIEWLSVLVREQTAESNSLQNKLLQDYIYYAHQYLQSSIIVLRTASLKIFHEISQTEAVSLISPHFMSQATALQACQHDPEQVLLLILIYTNLLKQQIESKQYQALIKGNNSNGLIKIYNPDNQKSLQQLKSKVQLLTTTIQKLYSSTSDLIIKQITTRQIITHMSQSKYLLHIFIDFINIHGDQHDLLLIEDTDYQTKSLQYHCPPLNIKQIKQLANEILIQVMTLHKTYPILSCLQLIAYCLENINIKKITTEFWNDIVVVIVTPLTLGLYEDLYCEKAGKCVSSLLGVFFVYDMMIDGFSEQLAESISVAAAKKCKGLVHIKALNDYLNTEYVKYRNQNIKAFIEELQTLLTHKGLDNLIVLRS